MYLRIYSYLFTQFVNKLVKAKIHFCLNFVKEELLPKQWDLVVNKLSKRVSITWTQSRHGRRSRCRGRRGRGRTRCRWGRPSPARGRWGSMGRTSRSGTVSSCPSSSQGRTLCTTVGSGPRNPLKGLREGKMANLQLRRVMRKTTIKIKMLQTVVYALRPSFVLMKLFKKI